MAEEKQLSNYEVSMYNARGLQAMMSLAENLSKATIILETFQGKPANILIALNMAQRMNADPLMVMQNMYIVYGNPSWSSKFLISCFNTCGRFSSIKYEFFGTPGSDDYGCRAWATEYATGERVQGVDVTMKMAKDEGWMSKKGSKWQTMPQLMLQYRAAAFLIRTCAPEISMGLSTAEEIVDEAPMKPAQGFVARTNELQHEAAAIAEHSQTIDVPAPMQAPAVQEPVAEKVAAPASADAKPAEAKRAPAWAKR